MKKVLVVDDSKIILDALKRELSKYSDIEVLYAQSYQEAMNLMRRYHKEIKVALLDVTLPDAPNGEVITLANLHHIPTIVLTGTLNKSVRANIQKKEIINYILKDKSSSIELAVKNIRAALKNDDKTVLIVDDSETARKELITILKKINLNVIEAKNGQEALEILKNKTEHTSLVITDYDMPIMDGLELTIKIREMHDKNELGIIAMSSFNDRDLIDDFLTFGANDFISKPLIASEVIARVNANLELIELFSKITDMANKDYMTGAYNRRYFFDRGNFIFLKAKRKAAPIAVAMIDIDKFKNINDTYGHDVGDVAIKEIKRILDKNLRTSDLTARFGGEEFCILLEDVTAEDTLKLFEKIRKDFEDNVIKVNETTLSYTVSFGVAYGMLETLEEMIVLSDEALYHSKENGRNQVTIKNT